MERVHRDPVAILELSRGSVGRAVPGRFPRPPSTRILELSRARWTLRVSGVSLSATGHRVTAYARALAGSAPPGREDGSSRYPRRRAPPRLDRGAAGRVPPRPGRIPMRWLVAGVTLAYERPSSSTLYAGAALLTDRRTAPAPCELLTAHTGHSACNVALEAEHVDGGDRCPNDQEADSDRVEIRAREKRDHRGAPTVRAHRTRRDAHAELVRARRAPLEPRAGVVARR